jgi:hypothetical protein
MQSDIEESEVPRGYMVLAHLFDWEADCQFDGWGAFKNISQLEFDRICSYFGEVGLEGEAVSLRHQMSVFRQGPDDQEALVQAASLHRHPYSGDLDRLEYLTEYFCEHASELLYAGA